jgi:integrase/recombinase XerD
VGVRAFLVRLPSRVRYWTVVDDTYRVVAGADGYLQHLRLGQDAAESTTKAYAEALALYLRWCEQTSRDWRTAADRLGGFITWLKHTPADPDAPVTGPGVRDVRSAGRINRILAVVRGFLRHGVVIGEVPSDVLAILYDISDDRHLPIDVRGENSSLRYVARPRHRLSETETVAGRATDAEVVALLRACRSARDRFIVLAMARAGLRRGELCGLRREDMHVVTDATMLGCPFSGAHLHVHRRDNPNGAWALNELLTALSGRAELSREIRPHMLRHGFGSNVLDAGGALDEAQALLGHISPASTQVYLHPSGDRLRQAVERVAARTMPGAGAAPGPAR